MLIGNELVGNFLAVAPYLKEVYGKDLVVWVTDKNNVLGYFPGDELDVGSDGVLGDDDPMRLSMKNRKTMRGDIQVGTKGMTLKEIDNPIFDERNNPIGCIAVGISLELEMKVANVAHNMNEAVENIDASVKGFAASADNIRSSEKELRDNINNVNDLTKEIGKVLSYTKRIAAQTNLLGLNAAIEAARAGEYGAGFGVVADEIRKMSVESLDIAKKIEELLIQINNANVATLKSSDLAWAATEEQVVETQKSITKLVELKSISDDLKTIAKEL